MALYTLNKTTFYKENVIDQFNSLIWTTRYNQYGDVTLVMPDQNSQTALVKEGTFLYLDDSNEIMMVDTVSTDSGTVTITGQTLVGFLANRIARNSWTTDADSWTITGDPGSAAADIVRHMCITGYMSSDQVVQVGQGTYETIPGLSIGAIAADGASSFVLPYGNVYDMVKTICDSDSIGFFMKPTDINDGTGALTFTTYRGLDRTSTQSTNAIVIFSPAIDSFTNVKELHSISGYKNVAYAWAKNMTDQNTIGFAESPLGVGETHSGFDRRTLMVDASDIDATDYTASFLQYVLSGRAADALANNNYVRMVDGKIVPQSEFTYGIDYNLGDIIELRASDNASQKARVVEYIRAQDTSGVTAYPTLSIIV